MRYEDSAMGSFQDGRSIDARDDTDALAAGARGPATGNTISGAGTITGATGADLAAPGARITAVEGAGGSDQSFANGALRVAGEHGILSLRADGNYSYTPKPNTPENVRDVFTYTLADSNGSSDQARLTIEIGKTQAVVSADAQRIVPGPDGVVVLPAGVDLSDIRVVGRDLVIMLPDGTQMVIVDGAIFVPQLVINDVEVPATNLAALLIESEPQPAAGIPQSSGGNFGLPVAPLDPGVPLGDLIPPTQLGYTPPEFQEVTQAVDRKPVTGPNPEVLIDDDDVVGANGIVGGVGDDSPNGLASGFLAGSGGDGNLTWDLLLSGNPAGFSYIDGPNGSVLVQQGGITVLTITVNSATGAYTVTQNAPIDHSAGGDENNQLFTISYTVTDQDGDSASGTIVVNVDDDTPTVDVNALSDANLQLVTQDADTVGAASDSATTGINVSNLFTAVSDYGADGAGTTTSVYALSTTGGFSGLKSAGQNINLYSVNGVIVGSTAGTAPASATDASVIFSLAVSATGVVTLTQFAQIDHLTTDPTPGGAPYVDHLASLADGAISVTRTVTITDGDGDIRSDSASIGLGANIVFQDDGPTLRASFNEIGSAIVDESGPGVAATISIADATVTYVRGDDPDIGGLPAIGKGQTSGAVISPNALFGADGPAVGGGIVHDLVIGNTVSGLTTTAGVAINLVETSNGVVLGVVSGTSTVAFAIAIDPTTGVVSVEQYLSIKHPDFPDNFDEAVFLNKGALTVTVSATDFDGDKLTSAGFDIANAIRFEDDGPSSVPVISSVAAAVVDESGPASASAFSFTGGFAAGDDPHVSGGIVIGKGATSAAVLTVNGAFGVDGPAVSGSASYALSVINSDSGLTTTEGVAITLVANNGLVLGVVANTQTVAFAIKIDPATGVVSVEQYLSIKHPDNPTNYDEAISLKAGSLGAIVTVTDGDGDKATSGAVDISTKVSFEDDGPSVSAVISTTAGAQTDETLPSSMGPVINLGGLTVGNDPDLADTTGIVIGFGQSAGSVVNPTAMFGADGPKASGSLLYDLIVSNAVSGLKLTDGSLVTLVKLSNGNVVGQVASGTFAGQVAFAVAIDANGQITVEQYLSLQHNLNGASNNDSISLIGGSLGVRVTAIDGDLDSAPSNIVDISSKVSFLDDGPSGSLSNAARPVLTLDETTPVGTETDGNSAPAGLASTTANFALNFNPVSYGADGAGTTVYNLSLSGPNVASGMYALDGTDVLGAGLGGDGDGYGQGSQILLNQTGNIITGSVGAVNYFTIEINPTSGVVTFTQIRPIWHSNTGNDDDSATLTAAANAINVNQVVTDADNDPVTISLDLSNGVFKIEDDGPVAVNDTDNLVGGQLVATGNVITDAAVGDLGDTDTGADDVGADIPGRVTAIAFGLNSDSSYDGDGNLEIIGANGTLKINAAGDYTYTRANGSPGGGTEVFTYTLTDADGDSTTATLTIGIDDAAPSAGTRTVTLDDDVAVGGPAGNAGGPNDQTPDTSNTSGLLVGTGGDGALTFTFGPQLAAPAGFTYDTSVAGTLLIKQGAVTIATVTITDPATGAYTVVQNNPMLHPAGAVGTSDENDALFNLQYRVTDADGDPATGAINITIDDDSPTIDVTLAAGEANVLLTTFDANTDGSPTTESTASSTANFNSLFGLTQSAGKDGTNNVAVLSYALTTTGGNANLSSNGQPIFLFKVGADIIGSTVNDAAQAVANAVFKVAVDTNGIVTVTQYAQIDHVDQSTATPDTDTAPFNDQLATLADGAITLTASSTLTDKDGDTVTDSAFVNIGENIKFADDGPDISATLKSNVFIQVDETDGELAAGEVDPLGGNLGSVTVQATNYLTVTNVATSADAPTLLSYALSLSAQGVASGLLQSATNQPIFLYNVGGTVYGSTALVAPVGLDASVVFTVSLNAAGDVTLTQYRAIEHGNTASVDELSAVLTSGVLNVQITARDFDGDVDFASVDIGSIIRFEDDGPSINVVKGADAGILLQTDDAQTIGAGVQDTAVSTANFGGVFSIASSSSGSDSPGVTSALSFELDVKSIGAISGLKQGGVDIKLYELANGVIVGSTSGVAPLAVTDASVVFAVSVDTAGIVTLTQYSQIDHVLEAGVNNAPFNDQLATLIADDLITLKATASITDADADTVSDFEIVNIGQNLKFSDDGPTIQAGVTDPTTELVTQDAQTIGVAFDSATADFAGAFSIVSSSSGADAPAGAIGAIALQITATPIGGLVDSGLNAGPNAANIYLYQLADGTIIGSTALTNPGSIDATVVFSLKNTGASVELKQYSEIEHDGPGSASNYSLQQAVLGNNLIALVLTTTITDSDGDTAVSIVSLDLGGNVKFDDDGLLAIDDTDAVASGSNGPATGNVLTGTEVAVAEDANGSDGVADTIGADRPASVTFIDTVTIGDVAGGVSVPAGGSVNIAGQYGTLTIFANGDYSYARTPGAGGGQTETFNYTITDSDGDTDVGQLTITIADLAPVAGVAAAMVDDDGLAGGIPGGPGDESPTDGASFNGTLGLTSAGDGASSFLFQASLGGTFAIVGTERVVYSVSLDGLTLNATVAATDAALVAQPRAGTPLFSVVITNATTGAYTVTLQDNVLHATLNGLAQDNTENNASVVIPYQVKDADGDLSAAPGALTITFDDDTPTANSTLLTGTVDEDGVSGGIAGGIGDVAGEIVVASGSVVTLFNPGADAPLSYSLLAVTSGLPALTSGGVAVTYAVVGNTLTASAGANTVFTFVLLATGSYTFTLQDQLDHLSLNGLAGDNTENDLTIALGSIIQATDADGDSVTANANGLVITVDDDTSTLGPIQNGLANNLPGAVVTTGALNLFKGADDFGSAVITANVTGLTSGGVGLKTSQSGNVLTAYTDSNSNNTVDANEAVFTLTIDPNAGAAGRYTFDLIKPLDGTVVNVAVGGSASFGAGPTGFQVLSNVNGIGSQPLAVVSGFQTLPSDGSTFNYASWSTTGIATGLVAGGVNGSTSGWGIDNNNFEQGEFFNWDFGPAALDDPDGAGSFVPPSPNPGLPNISTATFEMIGYTASDQIGYVVHFTDGTFVYNIIPAASMGSFWVYTAPAGKSIADIEMATLSVSGGGGKVDLTSVGVQSANLDTTIPFTLSVTDGDGDTTSAIAFTINVKDGNVPSSASAPVALDLNGDGVVSYLGHEALVAYDYNGDGKGEVTAWVGAQDGILVRDADGNGTVTNASEFVFGSNGQTDLQALAVQYGAALDAADSDFAKFGVWQDANSNGVADAGEYKSLTDLGIVSIALVSDGVIASAAGGDVSIAGSSSYVTADGSVRLVQDVSFAVGSSAQDRLVQSAANSNTAVLAAVAAAAGLAALPAAAAPAPSDAASTPAQAEGSQSFSVVDKVAVSSGDDASVVASLAPAAGHSVSAAATSLSGNSVEAAHSASVAGHAGGEDQGSQPSALLGGTDQPGANSAPAAGGEIAMPSLAAFEALIEAAKSVAEDAIANDAALGKIVSEALEGGHAGPDIDALLNALPGNNGADPASAFRASAAEAAVPGWDSGHFPALSHSAIISMEAAALHHDAVQPA